MKHIKYIAIAILCAFSVSLMAQEEATEQGKKKKDFSYLLPQQGDFALVIDGAPFLEYIGNLIGMRIGGAGATEAPDFRSFRGGVMGKYFLGPKLALRANLNLDVYNRSLNEYVQDDHKFFTDPANYVPSRDDKTDVRKTSDSYFDIGLGAEYRVGKSRVQGFFGGELVLGCETWNTKYKYANPITEPRPMPSIYDPGLWDLADNSRPLTVKNQGDFIYGLRGIVGLDIFITKNIAIGGELQLNVLAKSLGKTFETTERWNLIERTTEKKPGSAGGSEFEVNFGGNRWIGSGPGATLMFSPAASLNVSIFF